MCPALVQSGHQKKLMMAVKKLAELQKGSEGRGSQRRKPSQSSDAQEVPPHDGPEVASPKLSSFQDSELSGELTAALAGAAQEGAEPPRGGRGHQENSLGKGRDSEEGGGVAPRKEARVLRQSSQPQAQRPHAPPTLKTRQSFPTGAAPSYTPPHTPTKVKPSSPQTTAPPAGKMKPPQHPSQTERAPSVRPAPQSPTHRGHAHGAAQPPESDEAPAPGPAPPVSVPLLCLPPEDGDEPQGGDQGTPKKRAHSLVRYAVSDGEQDREEPATAADAAGKPGSAQSRMARSNSVRGQSEKSGGGSRAQAIALRQRKKGPPPPPPKRSSSTISSPNLADPPREEAREGGVAGGMGGALLDVGVGYHQLRRASDLGGAVDTGSAGSVRSIAAMLEMSSIGGGVKALQKPSPGGGQHFLQVLRLLPSTPTSGGAAHSGVALSGCFCSLCVTV